MSLLTTRYLEPAKVRTMVNSARRRTFYVRAQALLWTRFGEDGEPTHHKDEALGSGLVEVTAKSAMRFLAELDRTSQRAAERYPDEPRLTIGVSVDEHCFFIG